MCGIFALLNIKNANTSVDKEKITKQFMKGQGRGPEKSVLKYDEDNVFGFHRLAINGFQKDSSEQPIYIDDCMLICNGEIYNYKELHKKLDIECKTLSDDIFLILAKKINIGWQKIELNKLLKDNRFYNYIEANNLLDSYYYLSSRGFILEIAITYMIAQAIISIGYTYLSQRILNWEYMKIPKIRKNYLNY